jgi:E3 ubiquitin-protein ligase listerin
MLHGQISSSAGKRLAKYMPKAVGAWLAGLYDTDRAAMKAAQDSLRQVFSAPEKLHALRKAYQQSILQYCSDAIAKETTLTLSDERTVSPDDAEAKYCRVVSACISVAGSLLNDPQPDDVAKFQTDYDAFLENDKLWGFAHYNDPSVRRSLHRFLKICLSNHHGKLLVL